MASSSTPSQGFIKLFDGHHAMIKQFVFDVNNEDKKSTSIHTKTHFFVSIFGETEEDADFKTAQEFSEYIQHECAQVTKVHLKLGDVLVSEFNVNNPDEILASIRRMWSSSTVVKKRAHVEYISDDEGDKKEEDKDKSDESDSDDDEADGSAKRAEARARTIEAWKFSANLQKKLKDLAEQGKTMDDGEACLAGIQLASILKGDRLVFNQRPYTDFDQMNIVNMCNDIGMSSFCESEPVTDTQAASKAYDLVKLLCYQ